MAMVGKEGGGCGTPSLPSFYLCDIISLNNNPLMIGTHMYPTYQDAVKVSQDTTLTPSQKLHELFKNSKTEPLQKWIDKVSIFQDYPIDPSVKIDQAEVVEVNADGQILVFRYPDNTYHFIDAGGYVEIEGIDHIAVDSVDESTEQWFIDLLMTDDSPLVFYRGFWVDEDLQKFFLNSYPE